MTGVENEVARTIRVITDKGNTRRIIGQHMYATCINVVGLQLVEQTFAESVLPYCANCPHFCTQTRRLYRENKRRATRIRASKQRRLVKRLTDLRPHHLDQCLAKRQNIECHK